MPYAHAIISTSVQDLQSCRIEASHLDNFETLLFVANHLDMLYSFISVFYRLLDSVVYPYKQSTIFIQPGR